LDDGSTPFDARVLPSSKSQARCRCTLERDGVLDPRSVHENLGKLICSAGLETDRSLSVGERRLEVVLELAPSVDIDSYVLLPEMSEPIALLTKIVELIWRSGFDFDAYEERRRDFYSYPSVHPYVDSALDDIDAKNQMFLENKEYQTSHFRRLHIELGRRVDGFEVLHVVMFPRVRLNLPIVCLDIVMFSGRVSFAIVDASPVLKGRKLPDVYKQAMAELRKKHFSEATEMTQLPPWASDILSDFAISLRPKDDGEIGSFISYCTELFNFHLEVSKYFNLLDDDAISEVYQCHERFATEQRSNAKTTKLLEASFGSQFTDSYMRQTLFDVEPGLWAMPTQKDFGDAIEIDGKMYQARTGPLAAVESVEGRKLFIPKGSWNPGEEIAMLRLLNQTRHSNNVR